MNVETRPICAHGISPLQLSAWHDGDLPEAEASELTEHVKGCPACQARLASYDATARALRGARVPRADERLWRAVAAHTAGARSRRPLHRPAFRPRPIWNGIAAVAALVLIVASFAFAFSQRAATGVRRPAHHTAPAALQPNWQPVTVPHGVITYAGNPFGLAVSSTDGNTAYACATPRDVNGRPNPTDTGGKIYVWLTHNRAATWTPVADVPLAHADATACWLLTDDNNDTTVLALVTWQSEPGFILDEHQSAAFISHDSGASWQQLADPSRTQIVDFASASATTYAMVWKAGSGGADGSYGLYASGDGLQTWHEIDHSLLATESPFSFAVRPDTGEILLQTSPGTVAAGRNLTHLWFSQDGGTTWTQRIGPDAERFLVAPPVPGQPWRLCGDNFEASANPTLPTALACSTDGGETWQQRPVLQSPVNSATAQAGKGIQYVGMTTSGDLLATAAFASAQLYRLEPGSGDWQSLGILPGSTASAFFVPLVGSGGVLWAVPVPVSSGASTASTQFYTAVYPAG